MGLLGDLYSSLDSTKRRLSGLLSDPMGTLAQKVAQLEEDQNGLLNLQANAYPMAGNRTVLNSPDQIAQFRQQLADAAANMGMAGATVWHGSPHKFDKFDSSKIGTGEGAQAYGHGLYLAENPATAEVYASKLANGGGMPMPPVPHDFMTDGARYVRQGGGLFKQVGDSADLIPIAKSEYGAALTRAQDVYDIKSKAGNLYKVDLPDEHIAKMLDWDKPLSQQHPDVQAALLATNDPVISAWKTNGSWDHATGEQAYRKLAGGITRGSVADGIPAGASDYMKQQGIPGIRYLDGGSRGTGAGTSNYVVFPGNEGLLNILERNGQDLGF